MKKTKRSKILISILYIFLALAYFSLFGYRYGKDLLLAFVINSDLSSKAELITYFTTTNADWDHVQKSFGGIKVNSELEGEYLVLKPDFLINESVQISSMQCIRRIKAKLTGNQIRILVQYCLCNKWGVAEYPYTVRISKPESGEYSIVYNDRSAGFPVVGNVNI